MNNQQTNIKKKDAVLAGMGLSAILLFMFTTNPQNLSAIFLLVLPLLVAITSYWLFKVMFELFSVWNAQKSREVCLILAMGPTLIILLGSLRQLGLQDFTLTIILVSGMGWYIRRRQFAKESSGAF